MQKSTPSQRRGAGSSVFTRKPRRHFSGVGIATQGVFDRAIASARTCPAACSELRPACASAVFPRRVLRVLFVGAETPQEFREALRLTSRGHQVFVVNPRETDAARKYRVAAGNFLPARIEDLPRKCGIILDSRRLLGATTYAAMTSPRGQLIELVFFIRRHASTASHDACYISMTNRTRGRS